MPVVRQYRVRYRHASLGWSPYSDPVTANAVPVAGGTSYSLAEDGTLNVSAPGLLAFASDYDEDSLTANLVTDVSNGTLTLNTDGSFTYTPSANFNGSDAFTYRVYDGAVYSSPATVSLTITAVNDPPVGVNDPDYSVVQNNTLIVAAPGVLTNDTDVEGSSLTAVLVTDVSNGTLSLSADGSFSYTPNTNFTGTDTFIYKPNDGTNDGNNTTVTITVTEIATTQNDRASSITYRSGGLILLPPLADGDLTSQADRQHLIRKSYRKSLVQTSGAGLLSWSDLTYSGSFRLTNGYFGNATPQYGGNGGCWYDSANDSIWLTSGEGYGYLEYAIPTLVDISGGAPISSANIATNLQGRKFLQSDIPNFTLSTSISVINPGAMFVYSSLFYGALVQYYDGNGTAPDAYFVCNSDTLSGATCDGLYNIGSLGPGYSAQYVMDIPSDKQAMLGGYPMAAGTISGPVITRYSVCPSFIAFNPADISVTEPTPAGNYLYRSLNDGDALGLAYDYVSQVGGGFIPDGSNCVIFFGSKATTGEEIPYGEASQGNPGDVYGDPEYINDPYRTGKGYHSRYGLYSHCWWAYSLSDFEAVKNGSKNHDEIEPYAYGDISLPHEIGGKFQGGVAYDRAGKRVFICLPSTDVDGFSVTPLIHVYTHP